MTCMPTTLNPFFQIFRSTNNAGKSAGKNPDICIKSILLIFTAKFVIQGGVSPVLVACTNRHTDVVDLLVEAGADIHLATTEVYST